MIKHSTYRVFRQHYDKFANKQTVSKNQGIKAIHTEHILELMINYETFLLSCICQTKQISDCIWLQSSLQSVSSTVDILWTFCINAHLQPSPRVLGGIKVWRLRQTFQNADL